MMELLRVVSCEDDMAGQQTNEQESPVWVYKSEVSVNPLVY